MKLHLYRFKCYSELVIKEFPSCGISLISGESGLGKSTLLEAILWCLYGGMQHIYPVGTSSTTKDPSYVIVECEEFSIKRSQPPTSIEVLIKHAENTILTAIAAQAFIDTQFGKKDFFLTSSYIQQNTRCPMITASNAEKTQLLYDLTFGEENSSTNPDVFLQRIDTERDNLKQQIAVQTGKYETLVKLLNANYTQNEASYSKWINKTHLGTIDQIKASSVELTNNLKSLEARLLEIQRVKVEYELLLGQLRSAVDPGSLDPNVNIRLTLVSESLKQIPYQEEIQHEIKSLKDKLKEFNPDDFLVTPEKIATIKGQIEEVKLNISLATRIGFDYYRRDEFIRNLDIQIDECNKRLLQAKQIELQYSNALSEHNKLIAELEAKYLTEKEVYDFEKTKYYESFASESNRIQAENNKRQQLYNEEQQKYYIQLNQYQQYVDAQERQKQYSNTLQMITEYTERRDIVSKKILSYDFGQFSSYYQFWGGDSNSVNISTLQHSLQKLELLHNQLRCPHCNNSVSYTPNGKLEIGVPLDDEEYNKQLRLIQSYIQMLQNRDVEVQEFGKYQNLLNGLTSLRPPSPVNTSAVEKPISPIQPTFERLPILQFNLQEPKLIKPSPPQKQYIPPIFGIEKMMSRRSEALSIKVIDIPPQDILVLESQLHRWSLAPHFQSLQTRLNELELHLKTMILYDFAALSAEERELNNQIQSHHLQVAEYKSVLNSNQTITVQLSKLNYSFDEVLSTTKELELIKSQLKDLNELIEAETIYTVIVRQNEEQEQEKALLLQYYSYETNLNKLKTRIQELSSQVMEDIIETINYHTNAILNDIFEADIQVLLRTHKEIKRGSKLQVNLQVMYKSQVYDTPNRLSGGEQDRISIALTAAMATLTQSPFLLLDECMAALNSDLQERCVKIIQQYLPKKTILHISHSATKGQHHSTLELEKDS